MKNARQAWLNAYRVASIVLLVAIFVFCAVIAARPTAVQVYTTAPSVDKTVHAADSVPAVPEPAPEPPKPTPSLQVTATATTMHQLVSFRWYHDGDVVYDSSDTGEDGVRPYYLPADKGVEGVSLENFVWSPDIEAVDYTILVLADKNEEVLELRYDGRLTPQAGASAIGLVWEPAPPLT